MKVVETYCKNALSLSHLPGLDYSLNPYKGCGHNCAYCYVPNVLHISRDMYSSCINIKVNIIESLSKEIGKKKPGVIGLSTVTDPYQPVERRYELTRGCLRVIAEHGFNVCIQTKSSLVLRDLDLISRVSKPEVIITIGTLDEQERLLLEPGASSVSERLDTLQEIAEYGISSSVFFGPIYPSVTVDDLEGIIKVFKEHNVSSVYIDSFHLKPGVLESIKSRVKGYSIGNIFPMERINDRVYYNKIREEIIRLGRRYSLRIIDAF